MHDRSMSGRDDSNRESLFLNRFDLTPWDSTFSGPQPEGLGNISIVNDDLAGEPHGEEVYDSRAEDEATGKWH
jgi:hypothetical protein